MSQKFQRKIENFKCAQCGTVTKGTGYTDHCPTCLWSKHVDINPGDRMAKCGGLMEPIRLTKQNGKTKIVYRCEKCGYKHQVKTAENDNPEALLALAANPLQ